MMGAIARSFGLLLPALFLTQAVAQIQFTNSNYNGITEGQPFDINFAGNGSPVTIYLKQGPATNLVTISTIASGITTSPYTWTPSTTLTPGLYALQIDQGTDTNYSPMITISGPSSGTDMSTPVSTENDAADNFPATSSASGAIAPTGAPAGYGANATGLYVTGAVMPSGYNMTSGMEMGAMATGGMSMGFASSTASMYIPTDVASFEGAGSRVRVAQWVVCLVGAGVVVV